MNGLLVFTYRDAVRLQGVGVFIKLSGISAATVMITETPRAQAGLLLVLDEGSESLTFVVVHGVAAKDLA